MIRDRFEVIMNAIKTGVPIANPRSRVEEVINALVGAGGSDVSVTQVLTEGTKVATVTVDETGTDIYAPDPTDVSVTPVVTSGTKIAEIEVDGAGYDLYAPAGGAPDFDVISLTTGLAYNNPVAVQPNSFTNDSILCFEILNSTMSYHMFCLGRLAAAGPFTIGIPNQSGSLWYQLSFNAETNTFSVLNNITNAPDITNILAWK